MLWKQGVKFVRIVVPVNVVKQFFKEWYIMRKVCRNLDCAKEYELQEDDINDGYCSFDCWERDNCAQPQTANFEVDGLDWI